MKKEKRKVPRAKFFMLAGIAVTIGLTLYCMVNRLGLIDGLDFGAGAYYYADIPEFTRFVNGDAYQSETPMWVLTALFLAWGGAMYRLWSWLEKRLAAADRSEERERKNSAKGNG